MEKLCAKNSQLKPGNQLPEVPRKTKNGKAMREKFSTQTRETVTGGSLKSLDAMRLESMGIPYSRNRRMAHPNLLGHRPSAPVGRIPRCRLQGGFYNGLNQLGIQPLMARSMRCVFSESCWPFFHKAVTPKQNGWARGAQLLGNRMVGFPLGGQKANTRTQHHPLRRRLRTNPRFQHCSLFQTHRQNVGCFPHETSLQGGRSYCKDITVTLH